MQYVNLGRTGLKVSRLCLGTMTYGTPAWHSWVLDETASRPFIERALERGINFFDTADMYSRGGSEEVLGRALRDFARREEVVVKPHGTLDLQRELVERLHQRAAELEEDRLKLGAALASLRERFAQAEQAIRDREALLQQTQNSLQAAERALDDKEALLQETRRSLEMLQEDHANLRDYLLSLRQTPLFKLQDLLTKLSQRR